MAFGKKKKGNKAEAEMNDPELSYLDIEHSPNQAVRDIGKKKKKKAGFKLVFARFITVIAVIVSGYCICVFSNIPFIKYWRNIYIETAMGTMTHQWLATDFIPGWIIDDVMAEVNASLDSQTGLSSSWTTIGEVTETEESAAETIEVTDEESFYLKYWELDTDSVHEYFANNPDTLADGYGNVLIEDMDYSLGLETVNGDPVLVLDTYNNLLIVKVSGSTYQGKLAIMKNAKQVDLVKSEKYGTYGEKAASYAERLGSLVTINANRFSDPGGVGTGATIKGAYVVDGVNIGHYVGNKEKGWKFCGFKSDYKFYIDNYTEVDDSEYIWGMECVPALVINGESVVDGTFGMGIQPRTSVGQCENGDFMFLVVDGRQPGWSIGCSIATMADIMISYHCYQGMNMDGGSSAVMYYKTKQITKASSVSGRGRYTPNAFVFMPLDDVEE